MHLRGSTSPVKENNTEPDKTGLYIQAMREKEREAEANNPKNEIWRKSWNLPKSTAALSIARQTAGSSSTLRASSMHVREVGQTASLAALT